MGVEAEGFVDVVEPLVALHEGDAGLEVVALDAPLGKGEEPAEEKGVGAVPPPTACQAPQPEGQAAVAAANQVVVEGDEELV